MDRDAGEPKGCTLCNSQYHNSGCLVSVNERLAVCIALQICQHKNITIITVVWNIYYRPSIPRL